MARHMLRILAKYVVARDVDLCDAKFGIESNTFVMKLY